MQQNNTTTITVTDADQRSSMTLAIPMEASSEEFASYLKLIPLFLTYSENCVKDMFNEYDELETDAYFRNPNNI
jgi:hypothetical protein